MDRPDRQPLDLVEPVDRRVRRDEQDPPARRRHGPVIGRPSAASAAVGLGERRLAVDAADRPGRERAADDAELEALARGRRRRARPAGTRRRTSRPRRSCRPASTGIAGDADERVRPAAQASAPSAPELDDDDRAAVGPPVRRRSGRAPAAASSTSSMPAIRRASASFGKNTSAARSISRTPPSQRSVGSQFVSNDVVRPRARAAAKNAGQPVAARAPGGRSSPNGGAARGRAARRARRPRRAPRSCPSRSGSPDRAPLVRITVAPVGRAGSTVQAETSIPRPAIASSMNRPNASSPTTPTNATRSPRRAAPQAKIADELPTVIEIEPTIRSTSPKTRAPGPGPTMTMSGLISPTTRMSMSRSRRGVGVVTRQ